MPAVKIREGSQPATPSEGYAVYATVATPSLPKIIDDAGVAYTLAMLERAQSFTTTQAFVPVSTSVEGATINMPAGTTAPALKVSYNGTQRQQAFVDASTNRIYLIGFDNGTGIGCHFIVGRNTNASTSGAGNFQVENKAGTAYYWWIDAAGNFRVGTTAPTHANDLSGTVAGTQTSMAEAKFISDDLSVLDEVMQRIREGAAAVKRFTYRSGSYNHQEFEGVVIDYAPAYGMDRTEEHPAGKSLNEINIVGDLLRFASWAVERIEELTAKVAALEVR